MDKYKKLNEKLEEYLIHNRDRIYIHNIEAILDLLITSENLIDPYKELGINPVVTNCEEKIDGLTTISLARKFLGTIDESYVEKFDESFKDGSFGFSDIINENFNMPINQTGIDEEGFYYHNTGFEGNLFDGQTLVHEFFHYLNLSPNNEYSLARDFLTEMISIYMENKYLDFINKKGFNQNDINNIRLERYITTYNNISKLYYKTLALNLKLKLGYLDEETFKLIENYPDELQVSNATYEEYISKLDELDKTIDQTKFNPAYEARYFIGTIFSSYLLEEGDNNTIFKVAKLNDKINDKDLNFVEALEEVGLSLNEIEHDTLIEVTNDYYREVINNYNKKEPTKTK